MAASRQDDLVGDVFPDVLAEHVRRIQQQVPGAVTDEPDGVHRLRTSVRKLRTVLAVYKPVFDHAAAVELRGRLATLGEVLGEVRDLEVRREDVEQVGRRSRVPLEARERLVADLDAQHAVAHRALVEWCAGDEMRRLTADLVRGVADPPLTDAADSRARKVARRRLRKAGRRAARAATDVDLAQLAAATGDLVDPTSTDGAELLAAAHRLRKAGRRLAHAVAAVTDTPTRVLGSSADHLGAAGKQVQSTLGDHRDAVLLARWVGEVAAVVEAEGGDRSPYDRLARAAQRRAETAAAEAASAVDQLLEAVS
ncbi:CHAD domain-containing protein [Isoptericola jiangsuensis]|uniref:CHAD domain-containing protein n=1 Tax=Isoptericola jiangsuensis TaxID=548579 RepID=A0A2A9EUL8_9MICO|nr:CHAD domain-containing protein [Isoptericola jiangsuensis]PFG42433.1 CHAD domain-containing protein [Isoptericola jiangsuensis]